MKKCQLKVKCPSFGADGQIPKKHTGFAEDISPEILIDGFMNTVKSVAIIMDDLDVPLKKELNHWLIWNIPVTSKIPENIPYGAECANGTKQCRTICLSKDRAGFSYGFYDGIWRLF